MNDEKIIYLTGTIFMLIIICIAFVMPNDYTDVHLKCQTGQHEVRTLVAKDYYALSCVNNKAQPTNPTSQTK